MKSSIFNTYSMRIVSLKDWLLFRTIMNCPCNMSDSNNVIISDTAKIRVLIIEGDELVRALLDVNISDLGHRLCGRTFELNYRICDSKHASIPMLVYACWKQA